MAVMHTFKAVVELKPDLCDIGAVLYYDQLSYQSDWQLATW